MVEYGELFEQLESLIGADNALKVIEFFQGENIYFPKRVMLDGLHSEIYAKLKQGASYGELSRDYGYTKTYIRNIQHRFMDREKAARNAAKVSVPLAATIKQPPQGGLFDD
jgi:Mor family transcriptional regulator